VPSGRWETSPDAPDLIRGQPFLECTKLLLHALTWSMHSKGQETFPTISGINALLPEGGKGGGGYSPGVKRKF